MRAASSEIALQRRARSDAPYLVHRFILIFYFALLAVPLPAQTNVSNSSPGRYLLVVDTSAAMRKRAPAVQKAVSNLLLSSMHGQLRRGDTVGVWTFDEQLHAGRLPLQHWSPEATEGIARNLVTFLEKHPYQKTSSLSVVWPLLQRVIKESQKLTVLLISDGDERISGTPFDRAINEFFQAQFEAQKDARMPFIIVLRAQRGEFVGVTLNLAPWPVEFPPFPAPPKVAAAPKPKPPEKKPPPPTAPPLIVIGTKKPEAPAEISLTPAAPSLQPGSETPVTAPTLAKPVVESRPSPDEPPRAAPIEIAPSTTTPAPQPGADFSPIPVKPAAQTASESPKSEPTPVATPEARPATPASSPAKPEPTPEPVSASAPASNPPVQVVTATPPEKLFPLATLLLIGIVLLALAGTVIFLLQRRARAHASLITRSMNQDKK